MLKYTNATNVAQLENKRNAVAYCTASSAVYTSFCFYSKTKHNSGDIMHFFAKRKATNSALENVRVAIQNDTVVNVKII